MFTIRAKRTLLRMGELNSRFSSLAVFASTSPGVVKVLLDEAKRSGRLFNAGADTFDKIIELHRILYDVWGPKNGR